MMGGVEGAGLMGWAAVIDGRGGKGRGLKGGRGGDWWEGREGAGCGRGWGR